MKLIKVISIILILFQTIPSLCQHQAIDSLRNTSPKKNFKIAAGEFFSAEITPWVIDNNFRNVDYTHISWQTVKYNLSPSNWAWDNDGLTTNEFGHPYHGGLFFSAMRANGYSFWQSVPASFAGSYLWETFAENQPPAPNDFINTGFGGVILGEMTFKLSNKIIDNRSRGVKRQVSEVLALLVNPMNGLSRIINGKWGRVTYNPVDHDSSKIEAEFDGGVRRFRVNNNNGFGFYAHAKLIYGTPFENYKTPFSNILVNVEFGEDDSSKLNIVSAYGSLQGWRISNSQKNKHLLVLSANYDYINNEAFFYSAQSIKCNLFSAFAITDKFTLSTIIGGGPVILSAVPDNYLYEGRNYDFCSGVGFHGGFTLAFANILFYSINYRGGWLKTINGNANDYLLHAVTSELKCRVADDFFFCIEPGYFRLHAGYKNYSDVNKTYPYLRASLRYSLGDK